MQQHKAHIKMAPTFSVNLDQVEIVRSRMQQVNESQSDFLGRFSSEDVPVTWPEYLSKFNVLLSKHTNLSSLLIESTLQKVMLHPKEPLQNEQEQVLSTLLRTKQIPEIETFEQDTIKTVAVEEGLEAEEKDALEHREDEQKWEALLAKWKQRFDAHVSVCTEAGQICESWNREEATRLPEPEDLQSGKDEATKDTLSLNDVLAFVSSGTENGKGPKR